MIATRRLVQHENSRVNDEEIVQLQEIVWVSAYSVLFEYMLHAEFWPFT